MTLSAIVASSLQAGGGGPETDLTAFAGLTGFVLTGFLLLARLSQRVVDDSGGADATGDDPPGMPGAGRTVERTVDGELIDGESVGGESVDVDVDDGEPGDGDSTTTAPEPETADGKRIDFPSDAAGPDERTNDRRRPPWEAPQSGGETVSGSEPAGDAIHREPAAGRADPGTLSPGALLLNVALTQGLFGVLLGAGAWYFGVPADALGLAGDPLSSNLSGMVVGVGFGIVLWVGNEVASGLAAASGADYDEGLREMLAPTDLDGWALLLGATLPVIAVVEEFLFRAAAIGATSVAFGASPWALAVVSSVAFALGHGAQGRVGIVVTGGLGFALAAGFVLTNSLLVVVVAHYLVNALEFVVHEGLDYPDPIWS